MGGASFPSQQGETKLSTANMHVVFTVSLASDAQRCALSCQVLELGHANGVEGTSSPEPDKQCAELWCVLSN